MKDAVVRVIEGEGRGGTGRGYTEANFIPGLPEIDGKFEKTRLEIAGKFASTNCVRQLGNSTDWQIHHEELGVDGIDIQNSFKH